MKLLSEKENSGMRDTINSLICKCACVCLYIHVVVSTVMITESPG
jgi:hypothetical protein